MNGPGDTIVLDWDVLLAEAISGARLDLAFQPIVDLQAVRVAGYETLARFRGPAGLGPDHWFAAARERGVAARLDAAVVAHALAWWRTIPADCILSVNVEPESVASRELDDVLGGGARLDGLVIEVTEHVPIARYGDLVAALDRYRTMGALVAVDDAGAGYAGLQHILTLRPSFLKLDRSLVAGVDGDEAKRSLVEMLGVFASSLDAWLIAEGVERAEEATVLRSLGVPLGQGYYLARPAPPWAPLVEEAAVTLATHPEVRSSAGGLADVLVTAPWIRPVDVPGAGRLLEATGVDHVVVVDEHGRAVGVVDAEAALVQRAEEPWRVNVGTTAQELASRLAALPSGRLPAVVVCHDDAGRYRGTVTIQRLLAALSAPR